MSDREKVIKAIEICYTLGHNCTECPLFPVDDCNDKLMHDALSLLKAQEPGWISVNDRLPAETHSLFWSYYGKKEWSNAMWREQSDKVLVAVAFKDGSRLVTTGETHDGNWHTSISRTLNPVVTHWRQMPEPPEEE